jgi:undecaprenyl-diphosphatase
MTEIQAFLLGLLQGLTEFLPVSSSGHLELGNHLFHTTSSENLEFTITVHAATVLSTLVVFRKEILGLLLNGLTFKRKEDTVYISRLLLSAIPVAILGLFFRDEVESLFTGNLTVVGTCLLITATLLIFAHYYRGKQSHTIRWTDSLVIGIAQAVAVLPGLSRSGATISTGILLGNDRKEVARFSFLMVMLPVIGAVLLDFMTLKQSSEFTMGFLPLSIGFITAFFSGWLACKWMIGIVSRGKLIYFAIYCIIVGLIAIFAA